tara:strand:- start:653 stop:871 length:219 start_codon:yes stop_codon:yes gene_type:complete
VLWSKSSLEAAQHFILKQKHPKKYDQLVSHIQLLWESNNCEVAQCIKCDFIFSNPYIAGDSQLVHLFKAHDS